MNKHGLKRIMVMMSIAGSIFSAQALSDNVVPDAYIEGASLYSEANCQRCHDGTKQLAKDNQKMTTFTQLNTQVSACNAVLNVGWFPEEETEVSKFLNWKYYHFSQPE